MAAAGIPSTALQPLVDRVLVEPSELEEYVDALDALREAQAALDGSAARTRGIGVTDELYELREA